MERLDKTDILILRALQENARFTIKEVAARVHLTPTPVFERMRRLEREGYIKKYVAVLNEKKLGMGFIVFCSIKLQRLSRETCDEFTRVIRSIPEVTECYNVSGSFDFLMKVHVPDIQSYQNLVMGVLGQIESLRSMESMFVMDTAKNTFGVTVSE